MLTTLLRSISAQSGYSFAVTYAGTVHLPIFEVKFTDKRHQVKVEVTEGKSVSVYPVYG